MLQQAAKQGLNLLIAVTLLGVSASAWAERVHMPGEGLGNAYLSVCNRGKVTVDAYVAKHEELLTRDLKSRFVWDIESTRLIPGACERIYEGSGASAADAPPAYIGFGFTDSHGKFLEGRISQVPDLGSVEYGVIEAKVKKASGHVVLTKSDQKFCVRQGKTHYRVDGELETNCATFQTPAGNDLGQYFPMTSTLYFRPETSRCDYFRGIGNQITGGCSGGEYFLTVAAVSNDREMAAVAGNGNDKTEIDPSQAGQAARNALADYERKTRQEQKAAEERADAAAKAKHRKNLEDQAARGDAYAKVRLEAAKRFDEEQRQIWSAARLSPASYGPNWAGKSVVVKGTVSRVEVREEKFPRWLTIHFKESPDDSFVVCSPSPGMFVERGGDISDLVGKTLEAAGYVSSPPICREQRGGGGINITASYQWRLH